MILSSAFGTAQVSGNNLTAEQTMFNQTIENIQTSITNIILYNKVIKWQRELAYVSTLTNLNSGEVYTLDNFIDKVAYNIDLIAFNKTSDAFLDVQYEKDTANNIYNISGIYEVKTTDNESNITYYNSVIISREILVTSVNTLLNNLKETGSDITDTQTLANELISNIESSVNTGPTLSSSKYNTYTDTFNDVIHVKNTMNTQANDVDATPSLEAIVELITDKASDIDNMLEDFQGRIISGITTTRKIAKMIAEKVNSKMTAYYSEFSTTTPGGYLATLINYYSMRNDDVSFNTTKEKYYSETASGDYDNPFVTFKVKLLDLFN